MRRHVCARRLWVVGIVGASALAAPVPATVANDGEDEARARANMPAMAKSSVLYDIVPARAGRLAEVSRVSCRRVGPMRHRCRIFVSTLDGDVQLRGAGILRGYSIRGRSFRYRYRIKLKRRVCIPGTGKGAGCERVRRVLWKGATGRIRFPEAH